MFESLTQKMNAALRSLRGLDKLSEENIAEALKEVRSALISADVHFKVARDFIQTVKEQCIGQEVIATVSPGQQVVKVIHDELVKLLGEGSTALADRRPLKVMLVGLQGAGKTTAAAKLALLMRKKQYVPGLIACDIYRPAAIDQLETLARQLEVGCHSNRESRDVPAIAKAGMDAMLRTGANFLVFDTAGRLQIDEKLIEELVRVKQAVQPDEVLLVVDSAMGQEAVNVAESFHRAVGLTGLVLTKMDGDARGGAALSMKSITRLPIKFMGTGEKVDDLEVFHPDRIASRILGMGDVVSLVERAQENIDQAEAEELAEKMRRANFNFEDMLKQFRQVKKMGSIGSIMGMLPGMSGVEIGDREHKQMARTEAMILSMTPGERRNPALINGTRRMRIAKGSGMQMKDVNQLLKQQTQMNKMMKQLQGSKGRQMMKQVQRMQEDGKMPGMPGKPGMHGKRPR
jgi:signal recognition particle subunit SRP54